MSSRTPVLSSFCSSPPLCFAKTRRCFVLRKSAWVRSVTLPGRRERERDRASDRGLFSPLASVVSLCCTVGAQTELCLEASHWDKLHTRARTRLHTERAAVCDLGAVLQHHNIIEFPHGEVDEETGKDARQTLILSLDFSTALRKESVSMLIYSFWLCVSARDGVSIIQWKEIKGIVLLCLLMAGLKCVFGFYVV